MILNVPLSSLAESILTKVVGQPTSQALWEALEKMFKAKSQGRIMHLKVQLTTFKKWSVLIADYFTKMKEFANTLAAIDKPLSNCEVASYVLVGLSSEYDSLSSLWQRELIPYCLRISMVNFWPLNIVWNNIFQQLIGFPSTNIATRGSNSRGSDYTNFSNNTGKESFNFSRARGRGNGRGHGLPHQLSSSSNSCPICQVCGKQGHTTVKCYRLITLTRGMT
jgi:hypothetical protein